MQALYIAEAISTGAGRNGHVRSNDGRVDLDLASPQELGGSGAGANPEQLFAAGYAACFHNALQRMARERGVTLTDSSVGARVGLTRNAAGNFELEVELEVVLPDVEPELARSLADAAHQVCPYSHAVRGNVPVTIVTTDD